MVTLSEIYDGWKNYIFPNPQIKEIAKKRANICVSCDKLRKNKTCKLCGCYVPAKTRSIKSICPIKKW